jgi:ubiquinone/menaquinone biosynthesis C-methylase UbiE
MTMEQAHQVLQYNEANKWGGVMDGVHTYHLCHLARLIKPNDTVLDLCCGTANLLIKAAEIFTDTTFIGVDLSKTMLDIARHEAKQKNLKNISFMQDDVTTLTTLGQNIKVDVVISTMATHHLPSENHLIRFFNQASRLVKSDGAIYIADLIRPSNMEIAQLFVNDLKTRSSLDIFIDDYYHSLKASFRPEDYAGLIPSHTKFQLQLMKVRGLNFMMLIRNTKSRVSFWESKKINALPIHKIKFKCWLDFILLKILVR